jgi:hypothetical protein
MAVLSFAVRDCGRASYKHVMPKPPNVGQGTTRDSSVLKGWQQIAAFLGHPVSVAQRWARTGMQVTRRKDSWGQL